MTGRISRTAQATLAKQDQGAFNRQAALAMTAAGHSRTAIADTLGISLRTVRRCQTGPCPAFEQEQREVMTRQSFPRDPGARFLSPEDIARETALQGSRGSTRGMVYDLMSEGMAASDIAALLKVTKKAVEYHIREIKVLQSAS